MPSQNDGCASPYTSLSGTNQGYARCNGCCSHARIVEVNAVFAIVEKNGMSEEITNLYEELRQLDCVLQFVRSGRVAITTSCFERVNEYLADREAKYRQSKHQES